MEILKQFARLVAILSYCLCTEVSRPQLEPKIIYYKKDDTGYLVRITATTDTERIFYLIGSSNYPSPLSVMVMRGSLNSNVDVDDTLFFMKHNNDSINVTEITESHGILFFNVTFYLKFYFVKIL